MSDEGDARSQVLLVGAGFAGITAARELTRLGVSATLVEARDRIGGRTYREPRLGAELELGGAFVHWMQPHTWSEITRYGLTIAPTPPPTTARWLIDGELHVGTPDEMYALMKAGESVVDDAAEVFPLPFEPLSQRDAVAALDAQDFGKRLDSMDFPRDVRAMTEALWAIHYHCPPEEGALTQGLRWISLAGWSSEMLDVASGTYLIQEGGTLGLLEAIRADAPAVEILLDSLVERIDQGGDGVRVTLAGGEVLRADAAIVTAPRNALGAIAFSPPLAPEKQAAAREGQASRGLKVWMRVRGELEPLALVADRNEVLTWVHTIEYVDGDTLLVAWNIDATLIDGDDREAIQAALRRWLPDAEVVAVTQHNWVEDPLSRGTWPMLRPGQLSAYHDGVVAPEGALFFAGSDYAIGWSGFIDGAIESGMRAAREAAAHVKGDA